jgi:hypothetical protein
LHRSRISRAAQDSVIGVGFRVRRPTRLVATGFGAVNRMMQECAIYGADTSAQNV